MMKSRSQQVPHGQNQMKSDGFTLIEIVVVITIIAILTSLGLMVGNKVRKNSQAAATKDMLKLLDQAYSSLRLDKDSRISGSARDDQGNEFPVVDASVNMGTGDAEPSQAYFMLASGMHPSIIEATKRADKFVDDVWVVRNKPSASAGCPTPKYMITNAPVAPQRSGTMDTCEQAEVGAEFTAGFRPYNFPLIKDAWGQYIRFVHPKFDGGYGPYTDVSGNTSARALRTFQGKRGNGTPFTLDLQRSYRPSSGSSRGDADEGLCAGGVGYFYSVGPDGDPGTRDDNVYLDAPPKFPSETASFH